MKDSELSGTASNPLSHCCSNRMTDGNGYSKIQQQGYLQCVHLSVLPFVMPSNCETKQIIIQFGLLVQQGIRQLQVLQANPILFTGVSLRN
jgi:hypothetical protein